MWQNRVNNSLNQENKIFFLIMIFSCRKKSAVALGTAFGLLLLSVISKFVMDSISSNCYQNQCCLDSALTTISIAEHRDQYHIALALPSINIAQQQDCLALTFFLSIMIRITQSQCLIILISLVRQLRTEKHVQSYYLGEVEPSLF